MSAPKITIVDADAEAQQYERSGFVPVCQYGSIVPEKHEIGGIYESIGQARVEHGVFVYDARCVERVFAYPK